MSEQTKLAFISRPECPDCGSTTGEHDPRGRCYARILNKMSLQEIRNFRPEDQSVWGLPPSEERDQGFKLISGPTPEPRSEDGILAKLDRDDITGMGLFSDDVPLPPRKTALVQQSAVQAALTVPYRVDGSRHKGYAWAEMPTFERLWRETAAARSELIRPEVFQNPDWRKNPLHNFRYLEPNHLKPPWRPSLVMNLWWMHAMVGNYRRYEEAGHFIPWWEGADPSDQSHSMGERVFQIAVHTFREAGLNDYVTQAEDGLRLYRQRVTWDKALAQSRWSRFAIDIHEISRGSTLVTSPENWQLVVRTMKAAHPRDWADKLRRLRQAPLEEPFPEPDYGRGELSSPYGSMGSRKRVGYREAPNFGNLSRHTTNVLFEDWARTNVLRVDLFSEELWA